MRTARRLAVLAAAILALGALATTAAAATEPASGQFVEGPETILAEHQIGDTWAFLIQRKVTFSGTYSGTATFTEIVTIATDGFTTLNGVMEFEGTACGKPAKLRMLVSGRGNQLESVDGRYLVLGTGRSATKHLGSGTFSAAPGVSGDYAGRANC